MLAYLEVAIHSVLCCGFLLWIPLSMQPYLLLYLFFITLLHFDDIQGDLTPRKVILRNFKTRMRHCYFDMRRWFCPESYPHYTPRKRGRKTVRLKKFRRRRLNLNLLKRCRRQPTVYTPTLDGRLAPSRHSKIHSHWRRRKQHSKFHHWRRRVVNHEYFIWS